MFCTSDMVQVHEIHHSEVAENSTVFHSPSLVYVKDTENDPLEKLSFLIGKYLLKREKMLNAACSKCGVSIEIFSEEWMTC